MLLKLTYLQLLLLVAKSATASAEESPVCLSPEGSKSNECKKKSKANVNEEFRRSEARRLQCLKEQTARREMEREEVLSRALPCELYIAPSLIDPNQYGLFTGVSKVVGDSVAPPDIILPLFDARKNEHSPLHDLLTTPDAAGVPEALLESYYFNDVFLPGLTNLVTCIPKPRKRRNMMVHGDNDDEDEGLNNIVASPNSVEIDSAGVHRTKNATAGSFSYYHNYAYEASRDLIEGEELFLSCPYDEDYAEDSDDEDDDEDDEEDDEQRELMAQYKRQQATIRNRHVKSLESLQEIGICIDNLVVGPSKIPDAGRGAFAKHSLQTGQIISVSPVLHMDRGQMQVVEQEMYDAEKHFMPYMRKHGVRFSDRIKGQQIVLNYCFGHPDSNVLLLPYAPMVNFINHANDKRKANAFVRWSVTLDDAPGMKNARPMELFSYLPKGRDGETLYLEYVALRDIKPGEEILLDYGKEWVEAWEKHVQIFPSHVAAHASNDYVSASDFLRQTADEPIRTKDEQQTDPYPENLRTACYYFASGFEADEQSEDGVVAEWNENNQDASSSCLRPCEIISRDADDYKAVVYPMESFAQPDMCGLIIPAEGVIVTDIPAEYVTLVDKPYSSDAHLPFAFRHEISLKKGFLPDPWKAADPNPYGDFLPQPLEAGKLDQIRWADNSEIVTQNAHRLGLTPSVRETLLDYCEKMGITQIMRHVTTEDNGLSPGDETYIKIKGFNWFLQRPAKKWSSNLHWLSPGDMDAHDNYLEALSVAGFDEMLHGIGDYLCLDELVVFHVTFIAVDKSTKGYVHTDVKRTDAKTYNIIVPLMLAKDTPPELDLQDEVDDEDEYPRLGRYRYEYDVAALMGDDSFHGTSAVDYRMKQEMRLAATIYIAEVTEHNVDSIMDDYTQAFPPNDRDLLLSWAGRHWKRGDPTRKLPKPSPGHILSSSTLASE